MTLERLTRPAAHTLAALLDRAGDSRTVMRQLVNAVATARGLTPPWDVPPATGLEPLGNPAGWGVVELGEAARQLRAAGEEAGRRHLAATIAGEPHQTLVALQGEHLGLCATANAYAQRALLIRGEADRVEAAHPAPTAARLGQGALFDPTGVEVA